MNIQGTFPYNFEDASKFLSNLESELDDSAKKVITEFGVEIAKMKSVLMKKIARVISRPYTPSASQRTIHAQLEDIVDCMVKSRGKHEEVAEFLPGGYLPLPLDVSSERITPELVEFLEVLAEHAHNSWARSRLDEGYQYGEKRSDDPNSQNGLRHPLLIPYALLPDVNKETNRSTTIEIIKALQVLGFVIQRAVTKGCTLCWDEAVRNEAALTSLKSLEAYTEKDRVDSPLLSHVWPFRLFSENRARDGRTKFAVTSRGDEL